MKNNLSNPLTELSTVELQKITNRIVYLRQHIFHMTQHQFADMIEISQPYLSLLENQKKELNMDTLMQIASSLNINFDWLIYGAGGNDNIFQKDHDKHFQKKEALTALKKAYSLGSSDIEFIKNYLTLSDKERSSVAKASDALRKLF